MSLKLVTVMYMCYIGVNTSAVVYNTAFFVTSYSVLTCSLLQSARGLEYNVVHDRSL